VRPSFQTAPLLGRLDEYVSQYAATTPTAEAVVFGAQRLGYLELEQHVDACARALLAAGIGRGERVAVLATPRPEFWVTFLATLRIGGVWVGLNPKYRLEELLQLVGDCQPKLLLAIREFEGRDYAKDVRELGGATPEGLSPVCLTGEMDGARAFTDFLRRGSGVDRDRVRAAAAAIATADPALIVYTSGSTGRPKGAVLSHHGLVNGAWMQTTHLAVQRPSMPVSFPINHVACVADTCATTLVMGGKIVFQERFDPESSLRAVQDERCTMLGGVPTMLQMQLDHPRFGQFNLSSLELVAWGGAAMPLESVTRLQHVCARLLSLYGLTETSANIVFGNEQDGLEQLARSIGRPDHRVQCRVVDDVGQACEPGVQGELQFKSDFFFLGYWNRELETREAFTGDGWLKTGDLGSMQADGHLVLTGRRSEMYKSGGYSIHPREIELVLEDLPEVALAAVVGVPDARFQEVGHAFVVAEAGAAVSESVLREACRARLANYKVPKHFTVCAALPMLPVGKVDRTALRKAATAQHQG
jgi:acyl-CoA synthetase (AMP-forming)/AMP-acid ligase II